MKVSEVPFLNLGRLHLSVAADISAAIDEVIGSSAFIGGPTVQAFESAFAESHAAARAVGTNSGTDALALGLRALGVGPGDEVIVPSMTFIATAEAVLHVGATPVIVDVDPVTLLLDADAVAAARTDNTRAVIPVHLYGNVVPFAAIRDWREAGLLVLEDCAQAHLATEGDRPVGTEGDAGAFSFFPGKNLGAFGDAGALVTDNHKIAEAVATLRDHGRTSKYVHDELGYSSRMDGIQAAILGAKLPHLKHWTMGRRRVAAIYKRLLEGSTSGFRLIPWTSGSVHHLVVAEVSGGRRDFVRAELAGRGVATGVHYPVPLHRQPSLAAWKSECPVAEAAADSILSLPVDPLMTEDEVAFVAEAFSSSLSTR